MHLFFFNDTATTEIYTLSLHDALPISLTQPEFKFNFKKLVHFVPAAFFMGHALLVYGLVVTVPDLTQKDIIAENWHFNFVKRSEEHTSELQSRQYLVCRLLLEKKKILL